MKLRVGMASAVALATLASDARADGAVPGAGSDLAPPAAAAPTPRVWRAGLTLEFGTLRAPSGCSDYCQDAYGPALGVSVGRMVRAGLAIVVEGWMFQRDALALTGGAQLWLGDRGWLRGGLGVMATEHHNSDGGPGDGVGPAVNVSGGVLLARYAGVATALSGRAAVVFHDAGTVTSLTMGYGLAW